MNTTYECTQCGMITENKSHLCNPVALESRASHCGPKASANNMCKEEKTRYEFECGNCGRPTEDPDKVCHPTKAH